MKQIDFDCFFPVDFFNKKVNEPFNIYLIKSCLGKSDNFDVCFGDPNKKEPDLLIDGHAYELTLASDKNKSTSYIKQIKDHTLSADNIEDLSIECIKDACYKKSEKNYVTSDNSLSIILTIPVYVWTMKTYAHLSDLLPQTKLPLLLHDLKTQYIDGGCFKEILLHMPGFAYDWISYSCLEEKQIKHTTLTNNEIAERQLPYVIKTN